MPLSRLTDIRPLHDAAGLASVGRSASAPLTLCLLARLTSPCTTVTRVLMGQGHLELRDEVRGGLRVFSVSAPRDTMRASLFFRVGQADETLATSGWTHLLEHSALHDWKDPRLAFNASVGLYETRFDLDGETDAVLEHLLKLTRWLAEPDLTRIDHEAKVLRAESEQRAVGNVAFNYDWRFGAQGPGLTAYRELGLARASAEGLRAWAAKMFVASNAVLAADQHLPEEFNHALPVGKRHTPALPEPVASSLPGLHSVHSGLVASGQVTRSFAAGLAPEVIRRTLTDSFRQGQGVAYGPWADLERVSGDSALIICGSDISTEGRATCGSDFMDVLATLERNGPPQSVLDDLRIVRERQLRDPAVAPGIAWSAAASVMTDTDLHTFEQAHELASAVTPEQVAEAVGELRKSIVLGLPQGAEPIAGVEVLRGRTTFVADGAKRHRHDAGGAALWLSDDALQQTAGGQLTTVWFTTVAGLLEFPDGARQVISQDGWAISVEPNTYQGGPRIVEVLDARVPHDLRLPQPPRHPEHIPKRIGPVKRMTHRLRLYGRALAQGFREESWFGKVSIIAVIPLLVLGFQNLHLLIAVIAGTLLVQGIRQSR
ncbi:MAG TPA: hypothetical protein VJN29_09070 [Intrasporangium sp.]|uniref:hypothetical protein n=1 Tax=Intrasporangium sp. TaxID=1925024 RepID=UPI002B46D306|nr:hypothetical protein [Intrasporangium sp.]HKX67360.1 hypothetical protein [Intrasporangium sp.]